MGYYIEAPKNTDKAKYFFDHHGAELVLDPEKFNFTSDYALICIVENPLGFEAAGIAYDSDELNRFLPTKYDQRQRTWLKMKKSIVRKLNPQAPI
jgi:hypothetical protein